MRRFLSTWLALIVIAVFALSLLVCAPLLTRSAEQTARSDLNALLDAAFAQFNATGEDAEAVSDVSESGILAKARAVARLLAHDDALLQTDALVSLCELLEVAAIDVTDYTGEVAASSVVGRIGRDLTTEAGTAWTKEVLDGEAIERTRVDDVDKALLWGCVPRSDTEGFILVQSLDVAILAANASVNPELVLSEFSFINDELAVADDDGTDGAYLANERYYVRRTQVVAGEYGELTLLASRSLRSVYVLRNAVLLVLCVIGLISIACALAVQVLLLRRRIARSHISFNQKPLLPEDLASEEPLSEAEAALLLIEPADSPDEADAPEPALELLAAEVAAPLAPAQKPRKNRARKPRKKIFELIAVEETDDESAPEPLAAEKEAHGVADEALVQDGANAPADGDAQEPPAPQPRTKKKRRSARAVSQDAPASSAPSAPDGGPTPALTADEPAARQAEPAPADSQPANKRRKRGRAAQTAPGAPGRKTDEQMDAAEQMENRFDKIF